MGARSAGPFVLDRQYEALYGSAEHRRLIRGIVAAFPEQRLDPLTVASWPWHRTAFYVEWLEEQAAAEEEAERQAALAQVMPEGGGGGIESLVAQGAQVREVT